MIRQEIFDKVLAHLREQGKAAVDGGKCKYRATDGSKCAVGCLIPDARYYSELEGHGPIYLLAEGALPGIEAFHGSFLAELQEAHDGGLATFGMGNWEFEMRDIAVKHRLQYKVNHDQD